MDDIYHEHENNVSHCAEYISYRNENSDKYKNNARCSSLFNRLESFEANIGTVFTDFNDEQMKEFYHENIVQSVPRQAIQKVKFLKSYLEWLREQGYIDDKTYVMHPFFRIISIPSESSSVDGSYKYGTIHEMTKDSSVDLEHIRNTMFFSEKEFEDYCGSVLKKENFEMELAIYCLAWVGVPVQSIGYIRRDWVNENNKSVSYPDLKQGNALIEVKVNSSFCFESILKARDSVGYTIERENGLPLRVEYKSSDYPYLIRQASTNKRSDASPNEGYSRLRGILSHLMTKIKKESSALPDGNPFKYKRVSLRNVYSSGLFYRYSIIEDQVKNPFVHLGNCRYYNYIIWKKAIPEL